MSRRLVIVFTAVVLVALGVLVFGHAIGRALVAATVDGVTGYRVAFDRLALGSDAIDARGVVVTNASGEPVLEADRMLAHYRLRDLFPGGERRFGVRSLEIDRPRFHLIRHADGGFNLPVSKSAAGGGAAGSAGGTPLKFALVVRDGVVDLSDPNRALAFSRNLSIDAIDATASIDTSAHSTYRVAADVGGFREQAFVLRGRMDAGGYALHHLTARSVALAPLVDYLINNRASELDKGIARDVDVRAYAFRGADGSAPYHVLGSASLDDGELRIPGLLVPASGMRGRIDVYDDGLVTPHMSATLGAVPVRLTGGIFAWSALAFRLGVVADAPLGAVRGLFAFSQNLPLRGGVHVETLLESAVGAPLVATSVSAPRAAFGAFPFEGVRGRAIYYASEVDVVGAHAGYGALRATSDGAIALGTVPHLQVVLSAAGPADGVPYAAQLAPHATLHATALLDGDGSRIDARGVAEGRGNDVSLHGLFHIDPDGDGAFAPIVIARGGDAIARGAFYMNRLHDESAFWADARDLPFARVPSDPHLPGLALAPPVFGGSLDGSVAGDGPPSNFRIAGTLRGRSLHVADVRIDDVTTTLAGTFASVHLGRVRARGPWGDFRGEGSYLGATLALAGTYHGDFSRLRAFTGDQKADGPVAGPVALLFSPDRTIVQARNDRSAGATVQGVPVDGISGTVAISNRRVRVYSAQASVAGGSFAAAGYLDAERGVGVSVSGASAGRLPGIVPLGAGRVGAIGLLRSDGKATRFDGGLALGEATLDRLPFGGNGDVSLAGADLEVRSTDTVLGAAFGSVAGSVRDVGSRTPHYDLGIRVAAMRIAPFAQELLPERRDIAGTLVGDLTVRGAPHALALGGTVGVPEGTVNGLSFGDASFGIAVSPSQLAVRFGRVTVGSTKVDFGARVGDDDASIRVVSKAANLADFNDYFDAGDELGGTGDVDVRFRKRGSAVRTRASLAIAALRYRRYDLGDANAHWTSSGRSVTGAVTFGGTSGRLDAAGTLLLPARAPLPALMGRSKFTGTASLRGLDLGVWLPALGYQVPIGGRVDADAKIDGLLRDPGVTTTATLADGTLGTFPVDRLEVVASSTLRRTTITRLALDLPSVAISGSGSFGLGERDPIAFALHAKSADVGPVAAKLLAAPLPLEGAVEADLKIDGTRAHPRIIGGFDLEAATFHGVAIRQALGEISISGRDIVLSGAEVGFAKGTVYLAGSVPLQVAPFGFGPAAAPITLDFNAKGVDLTSFAPLLPAGSTLEGLLDGHVAVGGSAGNPRLDGALALSGGQLRAPFEAVPLTGITGRVRFAGSAATLEKLHADGGGGSLDASGNILFANLVHPGTDAAYRLNVRASKLSLDVPAFVTGQIDGTLSLAHQPQRMPSLVANLALADAVIPFNALLIAGGSSGSSFDATSVADPAAASAPPVTSDVALSLDLSAVRNVRVRSANVDIGARGTVHVAGTRSAPQLAGTFTSTGGTISYFNTVFRLLDGTVAFQPDLGVIPNLDARAITHVLNPDPNTVRNVTGSADVTLTMHGPVTNLSIALSSDPAYDRQQILGLLLSAPALGATNLFGDSRGSATLYGSATSATTQTNIVGTRTTSSEFSVAQEAFGIANAQFTRTLLAPIETSVADAIGLTNINVNVDYTGNVGLTARKILGKKVNAIYGTSFGYPYRQTFGFEIRPNDSTAAQVTVFETLGAYGADYLTPTAYLTSAGSKIQAAQPLGGTAGFSISLQHLFR